MIVSDTANYPDFHERKRIYFDSLSRNCGLGAETQVSSEHYAVVSAAEGNVRVFFENERGLCSFSIGARNDARPLCSVEEVASRFPMARALPGGHQRLDLGEQQHFLECRWPDLQIMFAPDHIAETRKWQQAAAAAYTAKFTKK
jgi:hypothetical protein